MTLFGRELTLEQLIGFVKCNAAPTEDLVHMAALELIAALQDAQRRERAAVEDLYRIAACDACKHYDVDENACAKPSAESSECFEWRGPAVGRGEAE